jgi:hypothetical protein
MYRTSCAGTRLEPEGGVDSMTRQGQEGYDERLGVTK